MITSIKNKDYSFLFQEASDELLRLDSEGKLGDARLTEEEKQYLRENKRFTSLEQYFTRLGTLVSYAENPIKYLMLPLDEPCLEVNANTRTIDIPDNFKKYGASVQGDVIAETLFLRIDRFFDSMDFLETDAYIQWKLKDGTEGASKIPYIDYESEHSKGKLILVWPLTGAITAQEGPVQFSLRFLKRKGSEVVYSWNTIPNSITIKPALKPNVDYATFDDAASLFQLAIKDSEHTSEGDDVTPPSFDAPGKLENISDENTILVKNLEPDNSLVLEGQAWVDDQGRLSYEWEYANLDNSIVAAGDDLNGDSAAYFIKTADENAIENKVYYLEDASATPYGYVELENFEDAKEKGLNIYERLARCEIVPGVGSYSQDPDSDTVTGTYTLKATHKLGFDSKSVEAKVLIPGPEKLNFLSGDEIKEGDVVVGFAGLSQKDLFIDEEDKLTITTSVENDGIVGAQAYESMQYVWTKKDTPESEPAIVRNITTFSKEGEVIATPPTEDTLSLEGATPGWYQVTATSMLNRDTISKASNVIKVTKKPEAPVLTFTPNTEDGNKIYYYHSKLVEGKEVAEDSGIFTETGVVLTIDHEPFKTPTELYSEELIYVWQDGDTTDPITNETEGITIDKNTLTINAVTFDGQIINLVCKVVNKLNDYQSEEALSGTYTINFKK